MVCSEEISYVSNCHISNGDRSILCQFPSRDSSVKMWSTEWALEWSWMCGTMADCRMTMCGTMGFLSPELTGGAGAPGANGAPWLWVVLWCLSWVECNTNMFDQFVFSYDGFGNTLELRVAIIIIINPLLVEMGFDAAAP